MKNANTFIYIFSVLLVFISLVFGFLAYFEFVSFPFISTAQTILATTVIASFACLILIIQQFGKEATHSNLANTNLFESIAEAVLIYNHTGALYYANKSALNLLQQDLENVKTKSYTETLPLFSESGNSIYIGTQSNPFEVALQKMEPQYLKNAQMYHGETTTYLNVGLNPYVDENTGSKFIFVLMQDITEEASLEKMKLDFVAMAAHELRTPMTSIRGYLEILINETNYYLQPVHHKFLEHALLASDRLVSLMGNLLSVSQIERHKINLNLVPVNIDEVIEKTMQSFRPDAKEKNLKFVYIKPPGVAPKAYADGKYLQQIIDNLVSNAISYTAKGGVTVTLKYQPGGKQLTVAIKDTGQGIPIEALPHMFQKFYRVSSLLEQGSKGTGLGLYIAKKLVEMHGGRIWVESIEGKGTVFSFAIPTINAIHKKDSQT